jgi:hypothetical protein
MLWSLKSPKKNYRKADYRKIDFDFFKLILSQFSHSFFFKVGAARADSKYVLTLMNRWKLTKIVWRKKIRGNDFCQFPNFRNLSICNLFNLYKSNFKQANCIMSICQLLTCLMPIWKRSNYVMLNCVMSSWACRVAGHPVEVPPPGEKIRET